MAVGSNTLTNASAVNTNAENWSALEATVTVNKVTIAGKPVVDFTVKDGFGRAVTGLGNTSKSSTATVASYSNLSFALAKLVPGTNGSPSRWVSYIVTTVPSTTTAAAPTRPSTDNTGTLVDKGDGSYTYTFYRDVTQTKAQVDAMTTTGAANDKAKLDDLTYNANLTHRLAIVLSGNAPGTGTNTPTAVSQGIASVPLTKPVDVTYDFIPATGAAVTAADAQRNITANAKCEECHRKLGGIPGLSESAASAGFHGGSRNNVDYCVVCHTEQREFGRSEATVASQTGAIRTFSGSAYVIDGRAMGNLPNFIHKVHLGHSLANVNNDYAGVNADHVHYPQDVRNCTKCHDGSATSTAKTSQGDNWKAVPSRLACGSCHDGINFATGTGVTLADANAGLTQSTHFSGGAHPVMTDDSVCSLCHTPAAIDTAHLPVTPPNEGSSLHVTGGNANTNSAWIASNTARVPAGATKVTYEIQSVSRSSAGRPVIVFRTLFDGTRQDIQAFATAPNNAATGAKEMFPNFMGAPSAYFVWAVPQDGIAAPAEFNATASGYLRNVWNGTATGTGAGTITGPDANGWYTVTLTGVTVPTNATMLTGGIGYSYNASSTQPLTQTNVAGYPVSNPVATGQTNKLGGLIVVTPNVQRVATGFTGRRAIVEDARCNACHQELGPFGEDAFHGGQRNDGTTCAWCHTPNRASSGWSADAAAFVHAIHGSAKRTVPYNWHRTTATSATFADIGYPGILNQCETCHLPGTYDFSGTAFANAVPNRLYRTVATGTLSSTGSTWSYSPYIAMDVSYGSGFSFNAGTGVTTPAAGTTLVTSPIATACGSCHDSDEAITHFRANGGSWYEARSTALAKQETCLICHGPGRTAAIAEMHRK